MSAGGDPPAPSSAPAEPADPSCPASTPTPPPPPGPADSSPSAPSPDPDSSTRASSTLPVQPPDLSPPARAADLLARRVLPRAVVGLSRRDARGRLSAAARRRLGRRGRVELFFAFDDAASALALLDLVDRLAGRPVTLALEPVVRRGIPDDPAVDRKRRHAIADVRRRAPRLLGAPLARTEPLAPEDTAFLAEWVATAGPEGLPFAAAAMRRLWFETDAPPSRHEYRALWRSVVGSEPPGNAAAAVRRAERLMRRRRPYDTPAAWIHGQWFFAQDRLPQIAARLDDLGWR